MKILIYDHAGHPFQVQLSRSLARRGHEVLHSYCGLLQSPTPRGRLLKGQSDPGTFSIKAINLSQAFSRYSMAKRVMQERDLGILVCGEIERFKPDAVISANTPLGTQKAIVRKCRKKNIQFIFWVQDLLGIGIRNSVAEKIPVLGRLAGSYYIHLEHFLLRKSEKVILITEDFYPYMQKARVLKDKIQVIHNWAPLEEVPLFPKENAWSVDNGLDKKFCFIYTGTLGMKHNPELLFKLALHFQHRDDVKIIVLTEGLGADYLKIKIKRNGIDNLILMPFQTFELLPKVLATADVLIAILEPNAGVFAVPSKVLTYLCAKRVLLLSVPSENLASRIVNDSEAGIVVPPYDENAFIQAAEELYFDKASREEMARNGRSYAESTFDIEKITERFEDIIKK